MLRQGVLFLRIRAALRSVCVGDCCCHAQCVRHLTGAVVAEKSMYCIISGPKWYFVGKALFRARESGQER